ncbi:MAG TPA: twin-arginine translocase subunit TatC, partial [Candidatus Thermoplasmatota archaeon]|nr:twin-arginine translocase subunit TatC [Candidatus Thermoplasmatota archaeon]
MRLVALLALALALLAPTAAAASAFVTLERVGDAWNGESRVELDAAATRPVDVWVPANARIQSVTFRSGDESAPAAWTAAGADTLRVAAPADATSVSVRFDVPERRPYLAQFRAPAGIDDVTLHVRTAGGARAESPDVQFADGRASASVAPGDTIAIRVVDAGRVGELPLLLTVGGLSLAVLVGTLAWHRLRPPLGGREPQRFLDHLSELQARLLPPAVLFALLNLFYFASGLRALDAFPYLLPTWGVDASIAARAFDAVAERLVPPDVTLIVLRPADAVLAQVGMCLFLSLATVLPLLLYELAAFIAPGLEPRERTIAIRTLPI